MPAIAQDGVLSPKGFPPRSAPATAQLPPPTLAATLGIAAAPAPAIPMRFKKPRRVSLIASVPLLRQFQRHTLRPPQAMHRRRIPHPSRHRQLATRIEGHAIGHAKVSCTALTTASAHPARNWPHRLRITAVNMCVAPYHRFRPLWLLGCVVIKTAGKHRPLALVAGTVL